MESLNAILLKCKKSFILVLIFSIMNTSFSFGMTAELEEEDPFHSQIQLRSLENTQEDGESNDELAEGTLVNSPGNNISRDYVLAFQNEAEEGESKFLIFKKVAGLVGGIIVCIPQISVALAVGDYYGSRTLGYGFVGLTFLAEGGIASWIISEFIDDTHVLVKKVKNRETNSSICSMDTLKELKFGILSLVLGALSSCSDVYKTYNYNKIKELAIITFIFDAITRTLGLYKAFSSLSLNPINCSSEEHNILNKRGVEYIDLSKRTFLSLCKKEGIDSVCETLKNCKTPNEVYCYLTSGVGQNLIDEESISISLNNYEKGFSRKIVMGLSLIFPISSAVFDMVMAYKGYNLITDSPVASVILTGLSVLPTSALSTYIITRAADTIFYKFYLLKKGFSDFDYFGVFQPKVKKAFFAFSLLLGSSSSLAGFAIISDNMEGTLFSPIKYVVATVGVASGLIFGTYTIMSTIKGYGEEVVKKCNKGASYIFGCLNKLGEISNSIVTSSLDTVSDFIDQITQNSVFELDNPSDFLGQITRDSIFESENLSDFIDE